MDDEITLKMIISTFPNDMSYDEKLENAIIFMKIRRDFESGKITLDSAPGKKVFEELQSQDEEEEEEESAVDEHH